jgi:hypothetical protein
MQVWLLLVMLVLQQNVMLCRSKLPLMFTEYNIWGKEVGFIVTNKTDSYIALPEPLKYIL